MLRSTIIFCFHLLLFLVPFLWTPPTFELFEYPKMMFVYAGAMLILTLWLSRMVIERKIIIKRTFLDIPLVLFLISSVASTLFSIDPHTSLLGYYSRFHGGLFSTLSYLVLYYAFVSNASQSDAKNILKTILIAALFASLYAFPEHFGHSPSCYIITGSFDVACWVQDVQTRVFGTFGQPNWLAAYLISIIFIPLAQILHHQKKAKLPSVYIYAGMLLLFFLVLLFTKSRSGLAGLGMGIVLFSALTLYSSAAKAMTLKKLFISSLIFFLPFLVFGQGIFAGADRITAPIRDTIQQLVKPQDQPAPPAVAPKGGTQLEVGGTESGTIRQIVWQGALKLFMRYPLFGSGTETFAYAYYNVRPVEHNLVSEWDFLYNKAHNEFLNFLATTGIFGFGSYVAIIVVYALWSLRQKSPLTNALISGYAALAVSNFFGFSTVPVALIFFVFPAVAHVLTQKVEKSPVTQAPKLELPQYLLLSLIWILPIFTWARLGRMLSADVAFNKGKQALEAGNIPEAYNLLKQASEKIQNEPQYTDQYSLAAARGAASLEKSGQATAAAQLAQQALLLSNKTVDMNKVHLNFYKSRARLFIELSSLNPQYMMYAEQTLRKAMALAPTDAKLVYNLGLINRQFNKLSEAQNLFLKAIELKPNYEGPRLDLAELYQKQGQAELAAEQYRYILEKINPNNQAAQSQLGRP